MKKLLIVILIVTSLKTSFAQGPLIWSPINQVSSSNGYNWPRVSASQGNVNVIWGDASSNKIFTRIGKVEILMLINN